MNLHPKKKSLYYKFSYFTDSFINFVIIIVIISLLIFTAFETWQILVSILQNNFNHILHDIVFIIVLIKAYRILIYYLKTHHVSIKYIIEISIIAPAIEVIFTIGKHDILFTTLYTFFSLSSMLIYLIFYRRIQNLDKSASI